MSNTTRFVYQDSRGRQRVIRDLDELADALNGCHISKPKKYTPPKTYYSATPSAVALSLAKPQHLYYEVEEDKAEQTRKAVNRFKSKGKTFVYVTDPDTKGAFHVDEGCHGAWSRRSLSNAKKDGRKPCQRCWPKHFVFIEKAYKFDIL